MIQWLAGAVVATGQAPESVAAQYAPAQAAIGALVPGAGHLLAGEPGGAALTALGFFLPIGLDAGTTPSALRRELQESYLWGLYSYQVYDAHQIARAKSANLGYPQPFVRRNLPELLLAPFDPARLADGRIWIALGLDVLVIGGLMAVVGYDPQGLAGASYVFTARGASWNGISLTPGQAYGLNLAGSALAFSAVGAYEEALFRGVLQTELERPLGPELGNVAASTIFAGYHKPGSFWEFLILTAAGYTFGKLYQVSGYDLAVPAAAHAYADIGIAAAASLWPGSSDGLWGGYSNPLAIRFEF
ncbi:MAG: CPBP family intramembrane metalloprotease [Candidatus Sericytochromatia bacterium]|nr:CPBP family intramembrane metalloprotease [Candidatus Tanganyikabacteria bacterium]